MGLPDWWVFGFVIFLVLGEEANVDERDGFCFVRSRTLGVGQNAAPIRRLPIRRRPLCSSEGSWIEIDIRGEGEVGGKADDCQDVCLSVCFSIYGPRISVIL